MTLEGHTDKVRSLVVLAGGRLASASWDKSVRVWNMATGACEATLSGHTDKVWSLAALPDGRLVSGSEDLTIRVWSGKGWGVGCDATLTGHGGTVKALAVLPDGRLASGGAMDADPVGTKLGIWK